MNTQPTPFELHPFGEPIEIGGLTFELPRFTDPEHARYASGLLTRLYEAAQASECVAFLAAASQGFEAVTDVLWRVAMQGDGICPLFAGLLVVSDVYWSIELAAGVSDVFRAALGRGEGDVLRRALLPAIGNLIAQEREITKLLSRADPSRHYVFPTPPSVK